jgi:predicted ester cyclase
MTSTDARTFFEAFFDRLWTQRDPSAIEEMRAETAGSEGLGASPLSTDGYRVFYASVLEAFTDTRMTIERCVEEGPEVALWLRFHGTARDGTRVEVRGAAFARVEGGKIVRSENLWDLAGLDAQLGGRAELRAQTLHEAVAHVAKMA